jgi:hypothetical protein
MKIIVLKKLMYFTRDKKLRNVVLLTCLASQIYILALRLIKQQTPVETTVLAKRELIKTPQTFEMTAMNFHNETIKVSISHSLAGKFFPACTHPKKGSFFNLTSIVNPHEYAVIHEPKIDVCSTSPVTSNDKKNSHSSFCHQPSGRFRYPKIYSKHMGKYVPV